VVAGDLAQVYLLLDTLKPFVYRRYRDVGAFEALREMKGMIREPVERRELHDNNRIGAGGIREVKFIGLVFQLICGGAHSTGRHEDVT
jgi:glutamate-ammonia-ligase adenylyltransferase